MGTYRDGIITEEVVLGYQEYSQDEERSFAMVERYLRDIRTSAACLEESRRADREKARGYKNCLREHYKIVSANPMLAAVNSFFVFAGRGGWKVKLFKIQRV